VSKVFSMIHTPILAYQLEREQRRHAVVFRVSFRAQLDMRPWRSPLECLHAVRVFVLMLWVR